mmetsp:Transcript_27440/g.24183  ORF Transcript_27440/g.24183 Transcript_27440/m.24183 type:complete len:213 (-) Transcript_27440:896-1534(-)
MKTMLPFMVTLSEQSSSERIRLTIPMLLIKFQEAKLLRTPNSLNSRNNSRQLVNSKIRTSLLSSKVCLEVLARLTSSLLVVWSISRKSNGKDPKTSMARTNMNSLLVPLSQQTSSKVSLVTVISFQPSLLSLSTPDVLRDCLLRAKSTLLVSMVSIFVTLVSGPLSLLMINFPAIFKANPSSPEVITEKSGFNFLRKLGLRFMVDMPELRLV